MYEMELIPTHFLNAPAPKAYRDILDAPVEEDCEQIAYSRWHWRAAYRRGIRPDLVPLYEVWFEQELDDWYESVREENDERKYNLLARSIAVNGVEDPWTYP
jgi:hypothetical protein